MERGGLRLLPGNNISNSCSAWLIEHKNIISSHLYCSLTENSDSLFIYKAHGEYIDDNYNIDISLRVQKNLERIEMSGATNTKTLNFVLSRYMQPYC